MLNVLCSLSSLVRKMPYQYMILDQYPESLIALGMKRTSLSSRIFRMLVAISSAADATVAA